MVGEKMNSNKRKGTVLVTGASSGIGLELAKIFAQEGYNLVLVARNEGRLKQLNDQIKSRYNIEVVLMVKDLSLVSSAGEIYEEVSKANIYIDILVNNAGAGICGFFHEGSVEQDVDMITLNITSLTLLTKLFAREMVKRRSGRILNIASTGSYQPGPYIAVYYAAKAYVLSFSQALTNELKEFGVSVTAVCPGATKTEFSKRAGKADLQNAMDAAKVAQISYRALMNNKRVVVPGLMNKLAVAASKILPAGVSAAAVRKIQQNLTGKYK
jgi:uncharacterized protein